MLIKISKDMCKLGRGSRLQILDVVDILVYSMRNLRKEAKKQLLCI